MAGDWIKWTKGLERKREVLLIASILGISPEEVAGRLMRLWDWCDDNIGENQIDENCNAFVTLGAHGNAHINTLTGNAGMADAMVKTGWLVQNGESITFPNYGRHNGKTAKTRALTQTRVKRLRNARGVTKALPEKRREEKSISLAKAKDNPLPPLPTILDCDSFRNALASWLAYKGKPYKPAGLTAMLSLAAKRATAHGVPAVIDAMETASGNGWVGWDHESSFAERQNMRGDPRGNKAVLMEFLAKEKTNG